MCLVVRARIEGAKVRRRNRRRSTSRRSRSRRRCRPLSVGFGEGIMAKLAEIIVA